MMTRQRLTTLAALGSAGLLLGALAFQYIGGLAPCDLCITQRWPHLAAVIIGIAAFKVPHPIACILGAVMTAISGFYGVYHTGVERGIFEGPDTCTSNPIGDVSAADLMAQIMSAPLIRCDEVAWDLFGLSMASWNAIVSFGLAGIWLFALRAKP